MKKIITIIVMFALVMSLAAPVHASNYMGPDSYDIGTDLSKFPTKFLPAVSFQCAVLKGHYVTANLKTGAISLNKKWSSDEVRNFLVWPIEEKPGYYRICVITDYGNWLYLNDRGAGKYPNLIPAKFNNGSYIHSDSTLWRIERRTVNTGGRKVTGWSLISKRKWVFSTGGWASWNIILHNGKGDGDIYG